jgi:aspartate/glutamate racemase
VGLLWTKFTIEEGFYRDRLQANCGIEGLIPDAGERAVILGARKLNC